MAGGFFDKQPASRQQAGSVQSVAIGAASATLPNQFGAETFQIRLCATTACYYVICDRANIVAASAAVGSYLPANWVEFVAVSPGQKLTVIEASAAGTLSVTELA